MISESIVLHEKMFRYQLRVLFLKTLFSKSLRDEEAYRANLISLLDHASTEIIRMEKVVKSSAYLSSTYMQHDERQQIKLVDNLKLVISQLNVRLEKSNYLGSDQVRKSIHRVMDGVTNLASGFPYKRD